MSSQTALPRVVPRAASVADPAPSPGILDLYLAIFASLLGFARRHRLGLIAEITLIGLYFVLRSAGAGELVLGTWLVAAIVLALVAPTSGLVVLAVIAPFNDGILVTRDIGAKTILAAVLAAAVAVRWVVDRSAWSRPSIPVVLAVALLVGSGLGLVQTRLRWGAEFAWLAGQTWLQGVATMLVVFMVAVWVARRGELRPLLAALAATTAAGLISLVDFAGQDAIREGVLAWIVAGPYNPTRLTGVIRSPTSTAALMMIPASFSLVTVVLARDLRLRLAGAALAVPLLVAVYLTYSRAAFLAIFALAVIVGWRIRRWLGIALLVGGLVVGALLLPAYLSVRGDVVGAPGQPRPGQLLIANDEDRLRAWTAAARMFLDQPIVGQGYRAYRQLSVQFGDPILNAPHNEWLRLFAEGGIAVGIIGLAFATSVVIRLARAPGWLSAAVLASFISVCLVATFNNPFLFNQVTIPAFVIAGTGVALARSRPSEVEPAAAQEAGPAVEPDA